MLMRLLRGASLWLSVGLLGACASKGPAMNDGSPSVPPRPPAPAMARSAQSPAGDVVIAAMTFLDQPYQSGGQSVETGFDCSGFTRFVFGQALGIELPRSAEEQAQASMLRPVASRGSLQAGDLVFFNTQHRTF